MMVKSCDIYRTAGTTISDLLVFTEMTGLIYGGVRWYSVTIITIVTGCFINDIEMLTQNDSATEHFRHVWYVDVVFEIEFCTGLICQTNH